MLSRLFTLFVIVVLLAGWHGLLTAINAQGASLASTLTVNSVGELTDNNPGNGICATGNFLPFAPTTAECTLRAAIAEATALAGKETITFDVREADGVSCPSLVRIESTQNYPIADSSNAGMIIDGYTQCGAAANSAPVQGNAIIKVEIVPTTGYTTGSGFYITSANVTLRGLSLYNWKPANIHTEAGGDSATIAGNFVGLDSSGNPGTVKGVGIILDWGSSNTIIGGPNLADRNIVSGNANQDGIQIQGFTSLNNRVENNYIGVGQDGRTAYPNNDGVDVQKGTSGNYIVNNVISGNLGEGMEISHDNRTQNNVVAGNLIGPAADGGSITGSTISNKAGGLSFDDSVNNNLVQNNVLAGNYRMGARFNAAYANTFEGNMVGRSVPIDGISTTLAGFNASFHFADNNLIELPNNTIVVTTTTGFPPEDTSGIYVFESSQNNLIRRNMVTNGAKYGIALTTQVNNYSTNGGQFYSIYRYSYMCRTERNTISQNTIFANGQQGIHLSTGSGVTQTVYLPPNAYSGPPPPSAAERPSVPCPNNSSYTTNEGLDSPTITQATEAFVTGTACPNCTVEIFEADDDGDNGGRGEGKRYLGTAVASGAGSFSLNVNGLISDGADVTATATNSHGSTSRFSYNAEVGGVVCPDPPAVPTDVVLTIANNDIELSWGAAANAAGYNVYRSTAAYFTADATNRIAQGITTPGYIDANVLAVPDNYYYIIRSINACGHESADSAPVSNETPPTLSIGNFAVMEGEGVLTATVSLSGPSGFSVAASFATADGTAVAGVDYTAKSGSVIFPPETLTQTLTISILDDSLPEAAESFTVTLSNPSHAIIGQGTGTMTITDDGDAPPAISMGDISVVEGDRGTHTAVFTATLSHASGQVVGVDFATADGDARAGEDYAAASGVLTFAPEQLSRTISITIFGDTEVEADEMFTLSLAQPVNATLSNGQATGTITNDDSKAPQNTVLFLPLVRRP